MTGGLTAPRLPAPTDQLDGFDSGEPVLDSWLVRQAQRNQVGGGSRTYVTTRNGRVVGFYCLAAAAITHAHVAGKVRRNQPNPIPVILLGRLAVIRREQGAGLGAQLLRDAITRSVAAADVIGVRALLVHAMHQEARNFYLNFDFEPSPTDDLHLYLLIKDAPAG